MSISTPIEGLPNLGDPAVVAQTLLMRDFLHEIGQTASIIQMVSYNLATYAQILEPSALSNALSQRTEQIINSVDEFTDLYGTFRSIGRGQRYPGDGGQWAASTKRIERLTRLERRRVNAELEVHTAPVFQECNGFIGKLEVVLLCLIKENVSTWRDSAPSIIDLICRVEDGATEPSIEIRHAFTSQPGGHELFASAVATWSANTYNIHIERRGRNLILKVH